MFEQICYKKPFLKEVILRIDFPAPIAELSSSIPQSVSKKILQFFPISEPQMVRAQELQFSGQKIESKSSESMQFLFHGKEREKTLLINPHSIIFTIKHYKSYEEFIDIVGKIINEFYNTFKELTASRVGLRYVNVIDPNDADPLSWNDYINEQMLGIIDLNENKKFINRAFHILEYNFDGQLVKFQFGIANPDYPAIIKKKQFILDIDSYFHGAFEMQEILNNINSAHDKIQQLFESSITDKTRQLMKVQS